MHSFGTISIDKARDIIKEYDALSREDFLNTVSAQWNRMIIDEDGLSEYELSVRNELTSIFAANYHPEMSNKELYLLDLNMGLAIYRLLNPDSTEFTITDACNDDMWRYVTIRIIPDLTNIRYPASSEAEAKNINKKRFYSETRRIWIKSLWWYIHLSWQGDFESTYSVLKDNGIDNINKLIETPGRGYRLSLYRALMKEYSERPHNSKYFAGATKLNNAKNRTIEPSLCKNGEIEFVKQLFDEIPKPADNEVN